MSYSLAIGLIWMIAVAYWVLSAWENKPTVYRANPSWRALAGVGMVWLFVLIFRAYPGFFRRPLHAPSGAAGAAGIIVCAAGVALAIWARRTLGRNRGGNPAIKVGHELGVDGPYRLVRHPIYTGILTAFAGAGIGGGQVIQLFVLGLALISLWAKLRIEEALMLRQFPQAYPEYRKRTKALIPFVP